ncbi:MAG: Phosphoglycolate phosphatase [Deltaproteobacteria bacterium ADurb.Bin510]|nr:MAG: Phosphoglycolate phosphatase [Deltaproteobacteria bacterium ADurb.Bin510]
MLAALGVGSLFSQILAIEDFDFIPKPQKRPYLAAQERLGLSAAELLLVDDRPENVAAARQHGFRAVQVGGEAADGQVIATIYDLPRFLRQSNE